MKKILVAGAIASVLMTVGNVATAISNDNVQVSIESLELLKRKFIEEPNLAKKMIHLVNIKRYEAKLPLLDKDQILTVEATQQVFETNRIEQDSAVPGENVAQGKNIPEEIMARWMENEVSRKNILNKDYKSVGSGYYKGVWALKFSDEIQEDDELIKLRRELVKEYNLAKKMMNVANTQHDDELMSRLRSRLRRDFDEEWNLAKKMASLVNIQRHEAKLPLLDKDQILTEKATQQVLQANGIGEDSAVLGENVAYGQDTPEEIMARWMENEVSRKNILNKDYKSMGSGYYEGVWVLIFSGSSSSSSENHKPYN